MLEVDFKILKDYACEEFIKSLKTLIRFDISKEFVISVDYSKDFTLVSIRISKLSAYSPCADFISCVCKILQEKNIQGFPSKVNFIV